MQPILTAMSIGFLAGLAIGGWYVGLWLALGLGFAASVGVIVFAGRPALRRR